MKLLDAIRQGGWHSSIATSFSCDLPFYDALVEPRIRSAGCRNNILLVDARAYAECISHVGALAPSAGFRYAVVPVQAAGAYHPKVILQVGEKKGRILIGSANVSGAGWGPNQELVVEVPCSADDPAAAGLARRLLDFVRGTAGASLQHGDIVRQLSQLERDAPWLRDAEPTDGPVDLADGLMAHLVVSPGPPLGEQLAQLVAGDAVDRLTVSAPFWDADLTALEHLIATLRPDRVRAVVQPETVSLSPRRMANLHPDLKLLGVLGMKRYLHAKLVAVEGREFDHAYVGSANCSDAAMGSARMRPINVEAGLYLRAPRGTLLEHLGWVDLLASAALSDEATGSLRLRGEPDERRDPVPLTGRVELAGRRLAWWPTLADGDSTLELLDEHLVVLEQLTPVASDAPGVRRCVLEAVPAGIRYARAVNGDGTPCVPTVVHFPDALRRAAPGVAGARIQDLMDRIAIGSADFLDLLAPFEQLLTRESQSAPSSGGSGRQRASGEEAEDEGKMAPQIPYEQFLADRKTAARGQSRFTTLGGTDLGLLIDLVLARLAEDQEQDVDQDDPEADDLKAGAVHLHDVIERRVVRPDDLGRHRKKIGEIVEHLAARLAQNRRTCGAVDTELVHWVHGALEIVARLAATEVTVSGRPSRVVPLLDEAQTIDFAWAVWRLVGGFFSAQPHPPIRRLVLPEDAVELPDDVFAAWVTSAWSTCVAMAAAARKGDDYAARDLEIIGYHVYRDTGLAAGRLELQAVADQFRRLHQFHGFESVMPISEVELWHAWFLASSTEVAPDGWVPEFKKRVTTLRPDDRVWVHNLGPRYVHKASGRSVALWNPGGDIDEDGLAIDALVPGVMTAVEMPCKRPARES